MNYEINEYDAIESYKDIPEDVVFGVAQTVESAFGGNVTREDAYDHTRGDQVLVSEEQI